MHGIKQSMKTDRFMKNMRIALLLMAVGLMSVSCEEEKLDTSMRIPGLGGEEYIPNEIDEWLYDNFTAPYNIEVIYRWDASQVQSSWLRPIVPVEEDSVVTFMTAIRDVWFEPYERARGRCVSEEDDAQASSAGR